MDCGQAVRDFTVGAARCRWPVRSAKEQSTKPVLDIRGVVFAHLPEILAAINNPAALIAQILSLLQQTKAAA